MCISAVIEIFRPCEIFDVNIIICSDIPVVTPAPAKTGDRPEGAQHNPQSLGRDQLSRNIL